MPTDKEIEAGEDKLRQFFTMLSGGFTGYEDGLPKATRAILEAAEKVREDEDRELVDSGELRVDQLCLNPKEQISILQRYGVKFEYKNITIICGEYSSAHKNRRVCTKALRAALRHIKQDRG